MKIEMCESLFYSWLRHVKNCQLVQLNWSISNKWNLKNQEELEKIMSETDKFFNEKYGYNIYKKNVSLEQLFKGAECDVFGIEMDNGSINKVYGVDVAFHEAGLNYGSREETTSRIIKKCLRTAMCIYGYLNTQGAEIIFASPKINPAQLEDLDNAIKELKNLMDRFGYRFEFRLIANEHFQSNVIDPIVAVSENVSDTNELFMRSYQLMKLFGMKNNNVELNKANLITEEIANELKIGQIAQMGLKAVLTNESFSEEELSRLQDKAYTKSTFNLNYPLLANANKEYEKNRYYSNLIEIRGIKYALCSQWFEKDRSYLMAWLSKYQ